MKSKTKDKKEEGRELISKDEKKKLESIWIVLALLKQNWLKRYTALLIRN